MVEAKGFLSPAVEKDDVKAPRKRDKKLMVGLEIVPRAVRTARNAVKVETGVDQK